MFYSLYSSKRYSRIKYDLALRDEKWYDTMQKTLYDMIWYDMKQYNTMQQYYTEWYTMIWNDPIRNYTLQYDMKQYNKIQYDAGQQHKNEIRYNTIWY